MDIKVKKLTTTAKLPERQTNGSMGADLHADLLEPVTILPGKTVKIPTGIAIELPSNEYGAFVFGRSGLGIKHGIAPANCVGCIDSDYRGELIVGLHNSSDMAFVIQPGERIAQLVIMPVVAAHYFAAEELANTTRGEGGFGSTGNA